MTSFSSPETFTSLPDHTQLPESDGTFVFAKRAAGKNFQEHPRTEQERQRAEQERQRADRLAEQLRALGIEPEV